MDYLGLQLPQEVYPCAKRSSIEPVYSFLFLALIVPVDAQEGLCIFFEPVLRTYVVPVVAVELIEEDEDDDEEDEDVEEDDEDDEDEELDELLVNQLLPVA